MRYDIDLLKATVAAMGVLKDKSGKISPLGDTVMQIVDAGIAGTSAPNPANRLGRLVGSAKPANAAAQ